MKEDKENNDLEAKLHLLLVRSGNAFASTEQELEYLESFMRDSKIKAPKKFKDLNQLPLQGSFKVKTIIKTLDVNATSEQNLAMAARNGTKIPPEIRQRMNQHREEARENRKNDSGD